MITRRVLVAGVVSAIAAESAWAGCGSRRTQQIVLTGRISTIGADSMEIETNRGARTVLFGERINPAGFETGDIVRVTCRVMADGDLVAERIVRSGAQRNPSPRSQEPSGHKH